MPKLPSPTGKLSPTPGGWTGGLFAAFFVTAFIPAIGASWQIFVGLAVASTLTKWFKLTGWSGSAAWVVLGMIVAFIVEALFGSTVSRAAGFVTPWTTTAVDAVRPFTADVAVAVGDWISSQITSARP